MNDKEFEDWAKRDAELIRQQNRGYIILFAVMFLVLFGVVAGAIWLLHQPPECVSQPIFECKRAVSP